MEIIRLKETTSTNTYAKRLLEDGIIKSQTCVMAYGQTHGKGMQKNIWEAEANKNLTFSIICFPDFLTAASQFELNKMASLSVYDLLKKKLLNEKVSIKWPNDILIENKKVAGILIETSVIGQKLNWVIIGIGININQEEFQPHLPNATSLIHHTGNELILDELLNLYIRLFEERYTQLQKQKFNKINSDYLNAMFRFGIPSKFIYRQNNIIATIEGVNEYGWLQLMTSAKERIECEIKEIVFIL